MDLNLHQTFNEIDQKGMYQSILDLPSQLQRAYQYGETLRFITQTEITNIIIAGVGGSAIAGDLVSACYENELSIPIYVHRDYNLPAWVKGKHCLVIISSHSGNTEEVLSAFEKAQERACTMLVITTGGKLKQLAMGNNIPVWIFDHIGQPRTAVGWTFALLVHLFEQLNFLPNQNENIDSSVSTMNNLLTKIKAEIPTAQNPAKRIAGQLVDQYVSIFAAEHLSPVARRWKTQINELAKSWCQFEFLPEADHNTIAGIIQPEVILPKVFAVFLQSQHYNPRNHKRMTITFSECMVAGIGTDLMNVQCENKVAELWYTLLFGDLMAFYLAMFYEVDPTEVEAIDSLKLQLG